MVLMRTCRLLAQTTLRNILGTKNLHEILSDRESITGSMQVIQKKSPEFLFLLVRSPCKISEPYDYLK